MSHLGGYILVPAFKPPTPSTMCNLSRDDYVGLQLQASFEPPSSICQSISQFQQRSRFPFVSINRNRHPNAPSKANSFTLFEGNITYENRMAINSSQAPVQEVSTYKRIKVQEEEICDAPPEYAEQQFQSFETEQTCDDRVSLKDLLQSTNSQPKVTSRKSKDVNSFSTTQLWTGGREEDNTTHHQTITAPYSKAPVYSRKNNVNSTIGSTTRKIGGSGGSQTSSVPTGGGIASFFNASTSPIPSSSPFAPAESVPTCDPLAAHKSQKAKLSSTAGPFGSSSAGAGSKSPVFVSPTLGEFHGNVFQSADFTGLSSICRNIAASPISVDHFYKKYGLELPYSNGGKVGNSHGSPPPSLPQQHMVISIVWEDLSTNHIDTCATKTQQHMSDDVMDGGASDITSNASHNTHKQGVNSALIRSKYMLEQRILGILIVLEQEREFVYFLPLMSCLGDCVASSNNKTGVGVTDGVLPFKCAVGLIDRWKIVKDLLFSPQISHHSHPPPMDNMSNAVLNTGLFKIMYHTQLGLLSLLANSKKFSTNESGFEYNLGDYSGFVNSLGIDGKSGDVPIYGKNDDKHMNGMHSDLSECATTKGGDGITSRLPFDPILAAFISEGSNSSEADLQLHPLLRRYNIDIDHLQSYSVQHQCNMGRVTRIVAKTKGEMLGILELSKHLCDNLMRTNVFHTVFSQLEMPLVELLVHMELTGVCVDVKYLESLYAKVMKEVNYVCQLTWKSLLDSINNQQLQYLHQQQLQQFNLSSPEQVSHVLYHILKLPLPQSTPTSASAAPCNKKKVAQYSTSEEELKRLLPCHPIIKHILRYRTLSKLASTYLDGTRPFILNSKGINGTPSVHPNWNLTAVRTGRLSCSKPNMQNIPNKIVIDASSGDSGLVDADAEAGWTINSRNLYTTHRYLNRFSNDSVDGGPDGGPVFGSPNLTAAIARNINRKYNTLGSMLVSADYSQIEMRVLAHVCQDRQLMHLFEQGGDIYTHLAREILTSSSSLTASTSSTYHDNVHGLHQRQQQPVVDKEMRNKAKVVTLGVMYGMGPQAAAKKLNVTVDTVNRITDKFFNKFRQVKLWMQRVKMEARQCGYVTTILGRRRYLPDIVVGNDSTNSNCNNKQKALAERQAINTVIQGSASEIIKVAMLCVERAIAKEKIPPCTHVARSNGDKEVEEAKPTLLMQIHDELIYEIPVVSSFSVSFPPADGQGHISTSNNHNHCNNNINDNCFNSDSTGNEEGCGSWFNFEEYRPNTDNDFTNGATINIAIQSDPGVVPAINRGSSSSTSAITVSNQANIPPRQPHLSGFIALLKHCLEVQVAHQLGISVPLVVNIQVSDGRWGQFHKHEDRKSSIDRRTEVKGTVY